MLTKKASSYELVFLTVLAVAAVVSQGCDRICSRANALDLDEAARTPPSPALEDLYSGGLYGSEAGPLKVYAVDTLVLDDAARGKQLQLRVTYPGGAGPFPVIVWSHGASGTKDMYQPLVRHWASHGYVCIQANHSDSRAFGRRVSNSPEMFGDWRSRPADVAFILNSLTMLEEEARELAGKMDHKTIGVGGHSFGAHTAQLLAGAQVTGRNGWNESHADPRPRAFLLLSPQGKGRAGEGLTARSWEEMRRPFMVITGTRDYGRNGEDWEWRTEPFLHAPEGPKYLAVVDGGWHGFGGVVGGPQYHGAGPENPDHVRYVQSLSMAFWDRYLKEDAEAGAYLTPDHVVAATNYGVTFSTGEDGMAGAGAVAPMPAAPAQPVSAEMASGRWTYEDAVWHDAARSRDVPVRVYAPESGGSLPAVVFSHGGGESREAFGYLGSHWAANGYIAVFLTHLGSDRAAIGDKGMRALASVNDIAERPTDLRFAIGKLASGETGMALLGGRVDAERIAAAGQCAGSTTALAVAGLEMGALQGHESPRIDGLVRCVLALSPQVPGGWTRSMLGLNDRSWAAIGIPALVVTGTEDFKWMPDVRGNPSLVNMAYDGMAPGGKYLVEIRGAEHNAFTDSEPYYPARARDPRHHGWIQRATTAFLDAYLRGDEAAAQWLRHGALEKETGGECRQDHKGVAAFASEKLGAHPVPPKTGADTPRMSARATGPSQASPRFERMWRMLDHNRDGLLSRDEIPGRSERLRPAFEWFDKNNDCGLSQEEVQKSMEAAQQMQQGQGAAPSRNPAPKQPEPVVRTVLERPAEAPGTGTYAAATPVDLALHDSARGADVPLRVTFPEDAGARPLVVFSHYAGGTSADYAPLIRYWVAHGFICAQPDHVGSPKRSETTPGQRALSAWNDRPMDVRLVLDNMDTLDERMRGHGTHIDRQRIGVGGHLIGAHTAGLVAGARMFPAGGGQSASFQEPRVSAALLISPQGRGQGLTEASWREITMPMLVVAGSNNPSTRTGNPSEWRKEPYEFAEPPDKYLAWIEGFGGDCGGVGGDSAKRSQYPSTDPAIAGDMLALTTAFWETFLCGDAASRQVLTPEHWQTASPRLTLSAKTDEGQVPGAAKSHGAPSRQALEAAAAYSDRHGGAAVFVMHAGGVLFEHYANGADAYTALHVQSGTKGFWGPVVAAMIDDGLVTSFDELAAMTLPEWRGRARKQDITLRNLLELNAGLAQDVVNLQGHERPTLAPDLYAHAIDVPVVSLPGRQFSYGPVCYYALGEILKRKLADSERTPVEYLKDRILDPIGVAPAKWIHDESGNPHIPNGAWLTARDWAGYGQFLLQEGWWNGRRIVSAELMRALRQPSEANPGHGLALWLNTPGGAAYLGNQPYIESMPGAPGGFIYSGGEPDLFGALGGGKNRLYIVPSRSLVVVRQTQGHRDAFDDGEFLRILLEG